MGYPVDEAALMIEQDQAILEGIKKETKLREGSKAVSQTKEEQDRLLAKMQAYA